MVSVLYELVIPIYVVKWLYAVLYLLFGVVLVLYGLVNPIYVVKWLYAVVFSFCAVVSVSYVVLFFHYMR